LNRSLGSAGDLAGEVSTSGHVRIKQELRAYRQQLKSLATLRSLVVLSVPFRGRGRNQLELGF